MSPKSKKSPTKIISLKISSQSTFFCYNVGWFWNKTQVPNFTQYVDYISCVTWKRTWNFLGLQNQRSPSIDRVVEPHMALVMYWIRTTQQQPLVPWKILSGKMNIQAKNWDSLPRQLCVKKKADWHDICVHSYCTPFMMKSSWLIGSTQRRHKIDWRPILNMKQPR